VLILDDYQVITEEQVHTTLAYLVEHLPSQLRIIIATRADPPLPLPMQRARQHMLEVRTEQLRCTAEEVKCQSYLLQIGRQQPCTSAQTGTGMWLVG
jgi:LuxR family transcriptional regulator, maltose regulon positive regulatory protein